MRAAALARKPLWHDVIHRTTSVMEVKHRSIEIVLGWGTDVTSIGIPCVIDRVCSRAVRDN